MSLYRLLLPCVLLAACVPCVGQNWPQWRGPFLNGSTTETGLPTEWSTTQGVLWVTPIGPGSSTPVVFGDKVFISDVDRATNDVVALCIDASSGKVLWLSAVDKNRDADGGNTMATPSAVTDGKTAWFCFGTGALAAFDRDGKTLWRRELEKDYGAFSVKYGYSSSPLLYRGRLYIVVMQNPDPSRYHPSDAKGPASSFLLCLDGATGKTLWKQVRPTEATDESTEGYLTPVPYEGSGRHEIILAGAECLTGNDADTGAELWRWWYSPRSLRPAQRLIPSAIPGDGLVYAVRPRNRSVFAVKGGGKGVVGDDFLAWTFERQVPDALTPLLYQGRLYVMQDMRHYLSCLDAKTGKVLWQQSLEGTGEFYASPLGADGKVYCMSDSGHVLVLAAGDQFQVLSRIDMGETPCRSSISAANGHLFIRTGRNLYCVGK